MLRDIEDGTMCVLRTLDYPWRPNCPFPPRFKKIGIWYRWNKRIFPEYIKLRRYEGASRYSTRKDLIRTSKTLKEKHKRCKYYTVSEIALLYSKKKILSGKKYDMNHIKRLIRKSGKATLFDKYFHRK